MKFLILGGGKAGQEYSVHLSRAYDDVTLYVRETQISNLLNKGLTYFNSMAEELQTPCSLVNLVNKIDPTKIFDCIIILFRADQLSVAETLISSLETKDTVLLVGVPLWSFDRLKTESKYPNRYYFIPKKGKGIVRKFFRNKNDNSHTFIGHLNSNIASASPSQILSHFEKIQPMVFNKNLQESFDYQLVFGLPLLLALRCKDYSIVSLSRDDKLLKKVVVAQKESLNIFERKNPMAKKRRPLWQKIYFCLPLMMRVYCLKLIRFVPLYFVCSRVEDHFRTIENQTEYLTARLIDQYIEDSPNLELLLKTKN